MTASEFAFLALGLLLGIATGAALIEVLRARPPAHREVRVTVSPNSIPRRATTLAGNAFATNTSEPARGGPGDRREVDPDAAPLPGVAVAAVVAAESPSAIARIRTPVPPGIGSGPFRLTRSVAGSSAEGSAAEAPRPAMVGVPILREADPMLTALRATAAATAVAAMRTQRLAAEQNRSPAAENRPPDATNASRPSTTPAGTPEAAQPESTSSDEPRAGSARDPTRGPGGIRDPVARPEPSGFSTPGGTGMNRSRRGDADDPVASRQTPAPDLIDAIAAAARAGRAVAGAEAAAPAAAVPASVGSADATGPCADQRRAADERCAIAGRARASAEAAVDALRAAQRQYDDLVSRSDRAAATADPRSVRAAKEAAQESFRLARGSAGTHADVEAAAREWLIEINRINLLTRDSLQQAERDRAAAVELAPALERLGVEADAARITAEVADEACVAAREAVAACEEAVVSAPAGRSPVAAGVPSLAGRPAGGLADEIDEDAGTMASRAGQDAAIIRLLRGDHDVLQAIVARLGGEDPAERRRWQAAITGLLEALIARSIEASAFDFPSGHPFWGPFSRAQNREIASALASLGYRHDGFGGWVDERIPTQRDLSLAVGYAGLDPMRIRHWPPEAEMRDLLNEVTVAADEYVWDAAGTLTLGDLVTLLGRRADALTDLWNEWGAVRPLLLSAE